MTNGGVETVTIAGTPAGDGPLTAYEFATVHMGNNSPQEVVSTLVNRLKTAEGNVKEIVLAELKSAVGEQFDIRQDGKSKELRALEEQLAKLKEIHAKRTQQRDQIIADRVLQILRDVDGLGWGSDSTDITDIASFPNSTRVFGTKLYRSGSEATSPVPLPAPVISPSTIRN